jgi:ring-1,2-phenylacetyl-CoA epoxidase subunit PaaE
MSPHVHPLRVSRIAPDADDALIVSFEVPEPLREAFRFTQGQHLGLLGRIVGVEQRRSYSICSGVDDGELRVGVRKVDGGVFSTWLHEQLKVGDTVPVMTPEGRFFVPLEPAGARHYLAIAGGSGITPILSIAKTVLGREPRARFTLIYGNRRQRSAMFREELEDLKNRYLSRLTLHWVFSREQTDLPLYEGRLSRAKLAEFLAAVVDVRRLDHVFVCGPHGINDDAEAALLEAGMPRDRIHVERFGIPAEAEPSLVPAEAAERDAAESMIVIVRDGVRRELAFRRTDGNILDAAAVAGVDVPFSCRSGVCCTCRARLLEGEVRMDRNFALERHEVAAGFVLTCQSHPLSSRVVLSFDER